MALPDISLLSREQKKNILLLWVKEHDKDLNILQEIIEELGEGEREREGKENASKKKEGDFMQLDYALLLNQKNTLLKKHEEECKIYPNDHSNALKTLQEIMDIQNKLIAISDSLHLDNSLEKEQRKVIEKTLQLHSKQVSALKFANDTLYTLERRKKHIYGFRHNFEEGAYSYVTYDPRQSDEYFHTKFGQEKNFQSSQQAEDLGCGIMHYYQYNPETNLVVQNMQNSDIVIPLKWITHFNRGLVPFLPTCPICSDQCKIHFYQNELRFIVCSAEGDKHYKWDPRSNRHTKNGVEWTPF